MSEDALEVKVNVVVEQPKAYYVAYMVYNNYGREPEMFGQVIKEHPLIWLKREARYDHSKRVIMSWQPMSEADMHAHVVAEQMGKY